VVAGNGFLGILLRDLIGFRGNKRNEFHAAFNEEVPGFPGEDAAAGCGEDLADDFLDRCCTKLAG
jgi:hypothetical protein